MINMKWFKHYAFVIGFAVYDYPGKFSVEVFLGKRTWQIAVGGKKHG